MYPSVERRLFATCFHVKRQRGLLRRVVFVCNPVSEREKHASFAEKRCISPPSPKFRSVCCLFVCCCCREMMMMMMMIVVVGGGDDGCVVKQKNER